MLPLVSTTLGAYLQKADFCSFLHMQNIFSFDLICGSNTNCSYEITHGVCFGVFPPPVVKLDLQTWGKRVLILKLFVKLYSFIVL